MVRHCTAAGTSGTRRDTEPRGLIQATCARTNISSSLSRDSPSANGLPGSGYPWQPEGSSPRFLPAPPSFGLVENLSMQVRPSTGTASNLAAIDQLVAAAFHRTEAHAKNLLETDHGRLKARLRPI